MIEGPLPRSLDPQLHDKALNTQGKEYWEAHRLRQSVEIIFLQRIRDFWNAEQKYYWHKEKDIPIPVRLERATRRIRPYIHDWKVKAHKLETGTATDYPEPPARLPYRRVSDWDGTVSYQKPISQDLETYEYFPCIISRRVGATWGPEEMKWFLDGLRARHIEFENNALEETMSYFKENIKNFRDYSAFKTIINSRRMDWKIKVEGWVADPLGPNGIFKPLYWYNHPSIIEARRREQALRARSHRVLAGDGEVPLQREWYYKAASKDPLDDATLPQSETAAQKKKRLSRELPYVGRREARYTVPSALAWLVDPKQWDPANRTERQKRHTGPKVDIAEIKKILKLKMPDELHRKTSAETMVKILKQAEIPFNVMIEEAVLLHEERHRMHIEERTLYSEDEMMTAMGCLATVWEEKLEAWAAQMRMLGQLGQDEDIIGQIRKANNPFVVAVLSDNGEIDFDIVKRLWPEQECRPVPTPTDAELVRGKLLSQSEPPAAEDIFDWINYTTDGKQNSVLNEDAPEFPVPDTSIEQPQQVQQVQQEQRAQQAEERKRQIKAGKRKVGEESSKERSTRRRLIISSESETEEGEIREETAQVTSTPVQINPVEQTAERAEDIPAPTPQPEPAQQAADSPNNPLDMPASVPDDTTEDQVAPNFEFSQPLQSDDIYAGIHFEPPAGFPFGDIMAPIPLNQVPIIEEPMQDSEGSCPENPLAIIIYEHPASRNEQQSRTGPASRLEPTCLGRTGFLSETQIPLINPEENNGRFRNEAAWERYKKMRNWYLIKDLGFAAEDLQHSYLRPLIAKFGWKRFLTHCWDKIPLELIREVVANMDPKNPGNTWLRGMELTISAEEINEFYGITGPFDFVGNRHRLSGEESKKILSDFCGVRLHPTEATRVTEKKLELTYAPFVDLFRTKLNPVSNPRVCYGGTFYMLHRILAGCGGYEFGRLNVGAVINSMIHSRAFASGRATLCFPGFIYQYCESLGFNMEVFWREGSMAIQMERTIPLPADGGAPSFEKFQPLPCYENASGSTSGSRARSRSTRSNRRTQSSSLPEYVIPTSTPGNQQEQSIPSEEPTVGTPPPPENTPEATPPPPSETPPAEAASEPQRSDTAEAPATRRELEELRQWMQTELRDQSHHIIHESTMAVARMLREERAAMLENQNRERAQMLEEYRRENRAARREDWDRIMAILQEMRQQPPRPPPQ